MMEDNPLTIQEQERYALDTYVKQREKMSGSFRSEMNKTMNKETIFGGLAGGLAIGVIVGFIYGQTNARVPERDESGRITEYKYSSKKMATSVLQVIAGAVLAALLLSSVKVTIDSKKNRGRAEEMSFETFKKMFKAPLKTYRPETEEKIPPFRKARATALILNNLPKSEVCRLQHLAKDGLTRDEKGNFTVSQEAIAAASQIISNFIDYNPEVGYNVIRVMRGDYPTTYFLPSFHQKTR